MASRQKVTSGLILGVGALGLLVIIGYVPLAIEIVVALIVTIGSSELSRMILKKERFLDVLVLLQTGTALVLFIFQRVLTDTMNQASQYAFMMTAMQSLIVGVLLCTPPNPKMVPDRLLILPGIIWLVCTPIAIPLIVGLEDGISWLTIMLIGAVFADTGADLVGSWVKIRGWKTHKFAPVISPKKTWEGAVAGFMTAIVMTLVCTCILELLELCPNGLTIIHATVLGTISGIFGPLGDLVESWFKRYYGVKDSGSLIPGHGGILDRVDSIIFVGPPFLLYITQVIQ